MTRKIISLLLMIFALFFITSLGRSVYDLSRTSKQIEKAREKVSTLENEQQALKKRIDEVRSDEFIEKEARQKLNYVKEGEVVVVLPQENSNQQPDTSSKKPVSNWQKWLQVLIGKTEN